MNGENMNLESKPQFAIREATVDDTEAIRRVQAESWLVTYPSEENGVSYEWVKERTDGWLAPEKIEESKKIIETSINNSTGFYRLAEREGQVVGFVHASTNEDETKQLDAIYVRPDMFGTGLGHELMSLTLGWAGSKEITLEVARYNERAIRFYQKFGFAKVEGSEGMFKDVIPDMKMRREATNEV